MKFMQNNNPLVSIIIPTYNRAHLIGETLDSVLAQTYENWECIIVDDGSTDNTEEVVSAYVQKDNRFQFHHRPDIHKPGGNGARNYGFSLSKGEYINWFDSDDLMHSEKLEKQVNSLSQSNHDLSICQTMVFEGNVDNVLGLRKDKIYSVDFFNDFIKNEIKWLTQAPLIRKSFLKKNQLKFDEDIKQSQERDFFVKVLDKVDDYLVINIPLVWFRKHSASISHSDFSTEKSVSNFNVNYNILHKYNSKLNKETKLYIKRILKNLLKKALLQNEKELVNCFKSKILPDKINFSFLEKIKLQIGIFSMSFLKKGEIFFK